MVTGELEVQWRSKIVTKRWWVVLAVWVAFSTLGQAGVVNLLSNPSFNSPDTTNFAGTGWSGAVPPIDRESWAARTGERFAQEREFFLAYALRFQEHGWTRAARIARHHVVSRLNAASEVPGALLHHRDGGGASRLLSHAFR